MYTYITHVKVAARVAGLGAGVLGGRREPQGKELGPEK